MNIDVSLAPRPLRSSTFENWRIFFRLRDLGMSESSILKIWLTQLRAIIPYSNAIFRDVCKHLNNKHHPTENRTHTIKLRYALLLVRYIPKQLVKFQSQPGKSSFLKTRWISRFNTFRLCPLPKYAHYHPAYSSKIIPIFRTCLSVQAEVKFAINLFQFKITMNLLYVKCPSWSCLHSSYFQLKIDKV